MPDPYALALMAIPIILSLTAHEFAHARVALAFGDDTAYMAGRCTLNPLAHLDPIGTICLFVGPLGWARPVPVNNAMLRPYKAGVIAVSVAGVSTNLLLAVLACLVLWIMAAAGVQMEAGRASAFKVLACMLYYAMFINLSLAIFNMIPLYPLDGHHVLHQLLPLRLQWSHHIWQATYGRYILYGLIFLPWVLGMVHAPVHFDPLGYVFKYVRTAIFWVAPHSALQLGQEAMVQLLG